jgi:WhiB family redox-sensing transcriptional regulator
MNTPWSSRAACRGLDPTIFFPTTEEEESVAKAVCGECAVRELCLEHALGTREREGIWGGHTERERRRIIRRRRRTAS